MIISRDFVYCNCENDFNEHVSLGHVYFHLGITSLSYYSQKVDKNWSNKIFWCDVNKAFMLVKEALAGLLCLWTGNFLFILFKTLVRLSRV